MNVLDERSTFAHVHLRHSPFSSPAAIKYDATPDVLSAWKNAEAVCFDVDSTLCTDESIDELAAYLGVGEQVSNPPPQTAADPGSPALFAIHIHTHKILCVHQTLYANLLSHPTTRPRSRQ